METVLSLWSGLTPFRALGALMVLCFWYIAYRFILFPLWLAWCLHKQGVPGTPFMPFVGDLPTILSWRREKRPFYKWFDTWDKKFGRAYYFWLGPDPRLRPTDVQVIKALFIEQAQAVVKPDVIVQALGAFIGTSNLLLAEGEVHKRHRVIANPAFLYASLKSMSHVMTNAIDGALSRLLQQQAPPAANDGCPPGWTSVDMHEVLSGLTLDIVGRCAFGTAMTASGDNGSNGQAPANAVNASASVYQALDFLLHAVALSIDSGFALIPGFKYLPTPSNMRLWSEIGRMRALLSGIIAARRRTLKAAAAAGKPQEPEFLLDYILDGHESDEHVSSECLTFVMAGHETSGNALTWAFLLLDKHPDIREQARAEVLAVLGEDKSKIPTLDDLSKMPFLGCVIQETLRMYPPAPRTERTLIKDVHVPLSEGTLPHIQSRTLYLPAGTTVQIPFSDLHRDPEWWGKGPGHAPPEVFQPDRWKDGASKACTSPFAYLPFSIGPRNCIGHAFALQEIKLILAMFLQRVEWRVSERYVHEPTVLVTLRPQHGLPMYIKAR